MQRELKFRVWNKNTKKFLYKEEFAIRGDGPYILTWDWHHDGGKSWGSPWEDGYIIQQYTGLKDEDGREIYEGDIIHSGGNYPKYVIEYNERTGSFTASGFQINTNVGRYVSINGYEVIGNIFENPELLKHEH